MTGVPSVFCWSKFGDEAGELAGEIRTRKEWERARNDGLFLWGIGSSIGPSLQELLRVDRSPRILFTPMLSTAAKRDSNPEAIAVWSTAQTMEGASYLLPHHSVVTSRADPTRPPKRHYALVCRSDQALTVNSDDVWIDDADVRNLRSGSVVGSSQVTSVVRHLERDRRNNPRYKVAFTASLESPYLVTLSYCNVVDRVQVKDLASSA